MNQFTCKFHYLLFYCCEEGLWPRELIKEVFILGIFFLEGTRVHNHDGRCMAAECLDLILKHEVERLLTGDDMGFWNQWHAFKKTALPNLFQTVPQTEEKAFKNTNLLGPFSFKPQHVYACIFCVNYWGVVPRIFPRIFPLF